MVFNFYQNKIPININVCSFNSTRFLYTFILIIKNLSITSFYRKFKKLVTIKYILVLILKIYAFKTYLAFVLFVKLNLNFHLLPQKMLITLLEKKKV